MDSGGEPTEDPIVATYDENGHISFPRYFIAIDDVDGNMYQYGAKWTGTDISPEQIEQAKKLAEAENMITCRGVGASLSDEQLKMWDKEHRELLDRIAPEGLIKVDRTGRTSSYELFVSILLCQDNPAKEQLKALLEDYCNMVT